MISADKHFETARSEILFRIEHRDKWLTHSLLAQVGLYALSRGLEIGGVKATAPLPDLAAFAPAISMVFAAMYFVEDRILGRLTAYIADLCHFDAAASLKPGEKHIPAWDASPQLRNYATGLALWFRVFAQGGAFVALPPVALSLALALFVWRDACP